MSKNLLISKAEAREKLGGIGLTTLYKLLNENKIQGVKIGRSLKIKAQSINKYIEELPAYKSQNNGGV